METVLQYEGKEQVENLTFECWDHNPEACSTCGKMMAISLSTDTNECLVVLYLNEDERSVKTETCKKRKRSESAPPSNLSNQSTKWRVVLSENMQDDVESACFSPCSRYLAALCRNGSLHVWRIGTRRKAVRVNRVWKNEEVIGEPKNRSWEKGPSSTPLSPLSSQSDTLLSDDSIPFFTPFHVKENTEEGEMGWNCFFSPLGDALCVVRQNALQFFRISGEFGTLRPCCTSVLFSSEQEDREGCDINDIYPFPCFYTGKATKGSDCP
uniref:Uncharacterized protein n=1 Tax=Palpitomonas bilix TaxID=652834 RepID=A0A7S3DHZ7_9EUKA|mmetsp:Transcript_38689/g.99334  ORF Transcript_38689/g.99334 Transcript_38689/m.99334 type:complete len:268 (+) Transcript_38689:194-997(+)